MGWAAAPCALPCCFVLFSPTIAGVLRPAAWVAFATKGVRQKGVGHSHFLVTSLFSRAALKGTNLRGQTPICGFLRVPAVMCGFLRQSAVFCENLRFPNALFSKKRQEICKNQRKSARISVWARFVLSPLKQRSLRKGVLLPSKHLLSAFYNTPFWEPF